MPHPIDIHVGKRLKLKRTLAGLSQTELALPLDITFQQLQKYERGTNRLSCSKLYSAAVALGVPITYFFEGLQEPVVPREEANMSTRETLELMRAYYRIKGIPARKRVFELVKALSEEG